MLRSLLNGRQTMATKTKGKRKRLRCPKLHKRKNCPVMDKRDHEIETRIWMTLESWGVLMMLST